jgi:hypothetical protein
MAVKTASPAAPSTPGQVEFDEQLIVSQRLVVIEDPILNCPFEPPTRHFKFTEEGITNEIVPRRRTSAYFIPVPRPRNKGRNQLAFDTEWTADRLQ